MGDQDYEKLFVLEALVESVEISSSSLNLDESTKSKLRGTCVAFQFLTHPPLIVCEEDFSGPPSAEYQSPSQINFNTGKSCLFSIPSSAVPALPYNFNINVSVSRKLAPEGSVTLGTSVIGMGESFSALIHSSVAQADLPLQNVKTGLFDVLDGNNKKIGFINVFIRLSSYGAMIVGQFQVNPETGDFMVKHTTQEKLVEVPGNLNNFPIIKQDPNYVVKPPTPSMVEGPAATLGTGDALVLYQPLEHPQEPEEGNYKEIVAEFRGYSLFIKVPMRPKGDCGKKKKELNGQVCKYVPPLDLCDCEYPVPPEAIPRCGPC